MKFVRYYKVYNKGRIDESFGEPSRNPAEFGRKLGRRAAGAVLSDSEMNYNEDDPFCMCPLVYINKSEHYTLTDASYDKECDALWLSMEGGESEFYIRDFAQVLDHAKIRVDRIDFGLCTTSPDPDGDEDLFKETVSIIFRDDASGSDRELALAEGSGEGEPESERNAWDRAYEELHEGDPD